MAVARHPGVIRRACGILHHGLTFMFKRFTVKPGLNVINPDFSIIIEPFSLFDPMPECIGSPPILFQPLLVLAATTHVENTLINVVGLLSGVYGMTNVCVDGVLLEEFNFAIVDERGNPFHCCFRGPPAFWAYHNYIAQDEPKDVVIALRYVMMERIGGGINIFRSFCDLSKLIFNPNHPVVDEFVAKVKSLAHNGTDKDGGDK